MGEKIRHYKALMRKNWIIWKRTLGASICELICPVALMAILALARIAVEQENFDRESNIQDSNFFYPITNYSANGSPQVAMKEEQEKYKSFMDFSMLDFNQENAIWNFMPINCLAFENNPVRNVIAYGSNGGLNDVLRDELQLFFKQQRDAIKAIEGTEQAETIFEGQDPNDSLIDFTYKEFESEKSINDYIKDPNYMQTEDRPGICFGFIIEENSISDFDIKIFQNDNRQERLSQGVPNQLRNAYDPFVRAADKNAFRKYSKLGYSHLHNWIANAVLRKVSDKEDANIAFTAVPFKTDDYVKDEFTQIISTMLPFFLLLMYILPVYRMISRIVSEKQSKARESMKMMGMQDSSYWISWFIYYLIIVTIISVISVLILSANVIKYSQGGLIFGFFWIYGMSLFGLIIFLQAFFTEARTAAIAGTFIYFVTSFVNLAVQDSEVSETQKNGASILSTVAVAQGSRIFGVFESSGLGLTSENIGEAYDNYRFTMCLGMMALSFLMFLVLGLYLDSVLPSAFGLRKPWNFFLLPSYWCSGRSQRKRPRAKIQNSDDELGEQSSIKLNDDFETKYIKKENYESPSSDMQRQEDLGKYLKIDELKKTFSNGFQAVKGLNVKMYYGQIFALLGHNGAGKSTTISMLTGLLNSSSGNAEVYGHDLFQDMSNVRQFLGVCPQHDILFDLLTPEEHLQIFCDFKGVDSKTKKDDIERMMKDVDVIGHRNTMAMNLSGGNRRKLSVAIALIGGSKFVLLDEPTAGMDLSARRKLWNMLKNYKHNRIIILTTHYMDEADILGDRVGIMASGSLICLGSPLFLKNRFGVGYNLTMVKKSKEVNTQVSDYLAFNLGNVKKLSEISSEITFQIPSHLSTKFQDFFLNFDQHLDELDIRSYGVSITTLEEVFLRVGNGLKEEEEQPNAILDEKTETAEQQVIQDDYTIAEESETGYFNLFFIHLDALFRKRIYTYKRNWKGLLIELLVPVIIVLIGFGLTKVEFFIDSPARDLEPSQYPLQQRILANSNLVKKASNPDHDIKPQSLISKLPNFEDAFAVSFNDYSEINTDEGEQDILKEFDEDVFENRYNGSLQPYRYGSYFIHEANKESMQFKVSSFVNLTSQDVTALYPQFMYEAILKESTNNPNFKFKVTTAPFPVTQRTKESTQTTSGSFVVFVLAIGFALIPSSIVGFLVHEREKNLKHMQLISGMNISAYWISNYIFDTLKALIPVVIVIAFIYAFDLKYDNVWTVFLMFPVGVIPFTYVSSFLFTNENLAQTVTIFMHFIFAGIGGIVVFILRLIESTEIIGDTLFWVLKIVPSFCLTNSVMYASSKEQLLTVRDELPTDDFDIQNMGGDLVLSAAHFVFWTASLILIEAGGLNWLQYLMPCLKRTIPPRLRLDQDEDVLEEESRIANIHKDEIKVRVNKFRKVFTSCSREPICAVEKTSFGLDYGECFALLGVNGAGKSTTFKSLTNDIEPTSGEISINGLDVKQNFDKVRKLIGYCPQHDCIFDLMSVEEHLEYYSRIKGITKSKRRELIEKQMIEMNLEEHRHKPAGTLSGGNKRKLSVAMAIIGNPPIILLDEPSAGMDPEARRFMWSIVSKISQLRKQSAVILTTHSMEEAEALSTKMGIMVKGGIFKCFGSSQHIKNKYGTGYEVEVKVKKMTQEEESRMSTDLDMPLNQTSITLQQCAEIMREKKVDEFLINEIKEDGLGVDLFKEAKESDGQVQNKNFLAWLNVEQHGQKIIKSLVEAFGQLELLEHYNDYYKFRVPRQDKSIGYVFGMIESKKQEYGIAEYSVGQTTLEQIFQAFANLDLDKKGALYQQQADGSICRKEPSSINLDKVAKTK